MCLSVITQLKSRKCNLAAGGYLVSEVGKRLAQARRVLGAAMQADVNKKVAAEIAGISATSWGRWETGEDEPKSDNLGRFLAVCRRYGLTGITEEWINAGVGQGPPVIGTVPPRKAIKEPEKPVPHPATKKATKRKRA